MNYRGKFQSLIGFKINWNKYDPYAIPPKKLFQSLIGFKINWNENLPVVGQGNFKMFQSLIGFKINWNDRELK